MENLDELMRKKFESDRPAERFEFREEYWEQAEVLLEAEEKRRKRRRRIFWWLFGGMAVVAIVAAVAVTGGSDNGSSSESGHWQQQRPGDTAGEQAGKKRDAQWRGDTTAQNSLAGENMQPGDTAFLNNSIENPGNRTGQKFGTRQENTATKSGGAIKATGTALQPARSRNSINSAADNPSAIMPSVAEPVLTKEDLPARGKEQAENALPRNLSDTTNTPAVGGNTWQGPDEFAGLPVPLQLLDLPERDLDTPHIPTDVKSIKPAKYRKFSFGLAAAGALSQASPDGKRAGIVGGLFAHYRLAPDWSLTANAQWRYLSGNWANDSVPSESEQLHYSFGYQRDTWLLKTLGLHLVEIPVGLRWQRGTFAAEAGLTPALLLGVQGRLTNNRSESLRGSTSDQSRVWLDQKPYNRFLPAAFLGGEWKATHRLALTLRGTYRPGPVGKKPTDAPFSKHSFWLDAGLRWYFKN